MIDAIVSRTARVCRNGFGEGRSSIGAPYKMFKKNGVRDVKLFFKLLIRKLYSFGDGNFIGKKFAVVKSRRTWDGKRVVYYAVRIGIPWYNNGRL